MYWYRLQIKWDYRKKKLHNISFKVVPLGSDTLLPVLMKTLEASWEAVSAPVASAGTYTTAVTSLGNSCHIETSRHAQETSRFVPILLDSPSHCIPDATENSDIFSFYTMPFWNKFTVDEALIMRENLQHNLALRLPDRTVSKMIQISALMTLSLQVI
jgi:hypothetical protein